MIDLLTPRRISRSADHFYTLDGKTYPGVTGILKVCIDKSEQLKVWAANMTADAVLGLVEAREDGSWDLTSLDALLRSVGPKGVKKAITDRGSWQMDQARDLGTQVHDLADQWIRGLDPVIPDYAKKHVEHYKEWWEASGWTLRASEAMLVNPEFGYGGTLDLLCRDAAGKSVLADIKTGAKGVYKEAILQLAAYGMAELLETEKGLFSMPAVDRYTILHVTADKPVREIEVNIGPLEQVAWTACLSLYEWNQSAKGKL
jgi:hypothetical protein